jgi:hypothetical protein
LRSLLTYANIVPVLIGSVAVALVHCRYACSPRLRCANWYSCRSQSGMVGREPPITAGFFPGLSVSSSSSRTPVAGCGRQTQLTGVVGALPWPCAVGGTEPAPTSAYYCIGRCVIARPLVLIGLPTWLYLSYPTLGVLAIYRLLVGVAVLVPSQALGWRSCRHRVPVGWLASTLGDRPS